MKKEVKENKEKKAAVKPHSPKKTVIVAVSIALIVAILIGAIWAVVYFSNINNSKSISYLEDDLTKYLVLSESDYKGYTVEICVSPVTDKDVEAVIIKRLAENKGSLMYDGYYVKNVPLAAGDLAYLRYIGYTLDKNGVRTELDLDTYSNFKEVNSTEFEIGKGTFPVSTVEVELVGKNPSDYGQFATATMGAVKLTDTVFCTVSYTTENDDTEHVNETVRFDLADENIENVWGIGIVDYLKGRKIGITDFEPPTFYKKDTGEAVIFTQLKIDYAMSGAGAPLTVEVTVPYDDDDVSLRGKTVYFDIYIEKALCYERAEFNEDFVREKLGFTDEKLADYEGDDIVEKYKNMVRQNLDVLYEENCRNASEQAMWDYLIGAVEFKKLPQSEVNRIFDNYYYQFQTMYTPNSSYYGSLDAYICAYYGIEEYQDWRVYLTAQVEREVKEKLIFYSILKAENLLISDEEYPEIYRKELESDFLYYTGKTRGDYESDEAYEKALSDYEAQILHYYGEDVYRETIYYYYASEKMIGYANVVNTAE